MTDDSLKQIAYLSLGSNLGNRSANLRDGIRRLEPFAKVSAVSSLYETEPVETEVPQGWYLNCAVAVETELMPNRLLACTQGVEEALGRRRDQQKRGPRTLDIDIIFFADLVVGGPGLTIPHPAMQRRRFVLEPLAEIAPQVRHPVLKKTVAEMLAELPLEQDGAVRKVAESLAGIGGVEIAGIAALLQPYAELSPHQLALTSTYIDMLLKWNARMNLTAVREREDIVTRHFGESFFAAARLLAFSERTNAIDVGSGAGFPGLPMAIYSPGSRLTLIEANSRKAVFLNEVITALRLKNATVFNGRAETYAGTADLVAMRAVENFEETLAAAARLVRADGRIALMIGAAQESFARSIATGFEWNPPVVVPGSAFRVLAVGTKVVKVE